MKKKITPGYVLLSFISILFAAIFLLPLVWGIAVSLKPEGTPITDAFAWFRPPYTLSNYPDVLQGTKVALWMGNSVLIAVIATLATLAVTSLAAYAIAKLPFKGKAVVYFFFMLGLMVPGEATIVPLFLTVNSQSLIDTYAGIILPGVAGSMNIIIMTNFFRSVSDEIMEAARIDGASPLRVFFSIVLPLSRTVMVTVAIFAFLGSWNNYLWPLLCIMSESMFTLPVGLPTLVGTYTMDLVVPMTANMIASIPAIIAYVLFEKQITQSIMSSGVKG